MVRFFIFCFLCVAVSAQAQFYKTYWAEFDSLVSNHRDGRWRVNDPGISLHDTFGPRSETRANGLVLIRAEENLFNIEKAELYMEIWGGHPGTSDKAFYVNGRGNYAIPGYGTEAYQCTYAYPSIPIEVSHLVRGINAFQFAGEATHTFWGHYIMDEVALQLTLKPDHPEMSERGLDGAATVQLEDRQLEPVTPLALNVPDAWLEKIEKVVYLGHYLGFDDNGNRRELDWHGYTHDREWQNVIGKSTEAPFTVEWDTRMLPDAGTPLQVKAIVYFKNNLRYETPVESGLTLPKKRQTVQLYTCSDIPVPFWSRDKQLREATLLLPEPLPKIDQVEIWVKVWDGGAGEVDEPFKLNGHAYNIISGTANHDVVFTRVSVDPAHLKPGANIFTLYSDTHHHGIEVLRPGPCLIVRMK